MGTGFRTATSGGVAAPPYTNGPYTFSEDITFEGSVTVQGTFTFGDAATDNLIVAGDLRVNDDRFLHFGSDEDVSIEYDEDGTNDLRIIGADWVFDDDLKLYFGSDKDAYLYYDETTNDVLELSGSANGIWLSKQGGAIAANMLLLGAGTSGSPATTSVANKSFVEFRTQSTATSGDSRGIYWRHDLNGAGVSGEAVRAFSKVTAAAATARGAHISLDVDVSSGSVSGLGVGMDAQVLVGDGALSGGNYAVINAEVYSAGSSVDISGVTKFDLMRFSLGGDSTGADNVDSNSGFMNFSGFTAGSGNIIDSDITALTGKAGLRVYVDGALYGYIPIVSGS